MLHLLLLACAQAEQLGELMRRTAELRSFTAVYELTTTAEAGKTRVRFTRRDRFKDPAGQEIAQETPPIEKEIVETEDGPKLSAPQD